MAGEEEIGRETVCVRENLERKRRQGREDEAPARGRGREGGRGTRE